MTGKKFIREGRRSLVIKKRKGQNQGRSGKKKSKNKTHNLEVGAGKEERGKEMDLTRTKEKIHYLTKPSSDTGGVG